MHRRDLLTAAAATAVTGLAGCLAGGSPDDGDGDGDSDGGGENGGDSVPEVTDSSIETTGTECVSESTGGAAAEREGDTVTVDGVIGAPNPCHEAVLGDVEIHNRQLVLSVDVERDGGMCMQCLGAIDYTAEVTVSNAGSLDGVTAEHVGGDEHATNWDGSENASP